MRHFCVYMLYEKGSGKVFYVGYTGRCAKLRLGEHLRNARSRKGEKWRFQYYVYNKIRSLLKEDGEIVVETIFESLRSTEALKKEKKYIAWCKSIGIELANLTECGDGVGSPFSEEVKQKISATLKEYYKHNENPRKGKSGYWRGKKQPNEMVHKRSQQLVGRKYSEEHKRNIANSANKKTQFKKDQTPWNKGIPRREETRLKLSKSVVQMTRSGEVIKVHKSIMNASRETGVNFRNISSVCKGRRQAAGGFVWSF